ncbi:hypothetical protein [Peredibacter starrii]|uniref:Uncharacterized protein n=1 Tax=Peredibacter starrii TaxID=28202 RepID=A0AAX4HMB0_9BACT|nr:hypothetical protein [Peredibacter starrii]WPU64408.1 hypothetical protein SOO65_17075 [Peredibacter starrii]
MKRKDFYQLVQPLTDKLYRVAFALIPDDLQAEQLVIDGMNAFLLKERKSIMFREVDLTNKKETLILRRHYYKGILRFLIDIGSRRAIQLNEQMKITRPAEYNSFYSLDPKVRVVMSLRYDSQFTVEEIEDILFIPRFEIIEKVHNGRFLLLNDLNKGANL